MGQSTAIIQKISDFLDKVSGATVPLDLALPGSFSNFDQPLSAELNKIIFSEVFKENVSYASVFVQNRPVFQYGRNQERFMELHRIL